MSEVAAMSAAPTTTVDKPQRSDNDWLSKSITEISRAWEAYCTATKERLEYRKSLTYDTLADSTIHKAKLGKLKKAGNTAKTDLDTAEALHDFNIVDAKVNEDDSTWKAAETRDDMTDKIAKAGRKAFTAALSADGAVREAFNEGKPLWYNGCSPNGSIPELSTKAGPDSVSFYYGTSYQGNDRPSNVYPQPSVIYAD